MTFKEGLEIVPWLLMVSFGMLTFGTSHHAVRRSRPHEMSACRCSTNILIPDSADRQLKQLIASGSSLGEDAASPATV